MAEPTASPKLNTHDQSTGAFVHLHVHSEYSLTDGAIRIDDLIAKVRGMGHRAVALTDHGNLFGAIEFYTKAKDHGIKAIIGAELYVEPSSTTLEYIKDFAPESSAKFFQYVLLAKNLNGYHNLIKLVSAGFLENSSYPVPVVTRTRLNELSKDLFVISSFHGGELTSLLKELRKLQKQKDLNFDNPNSDDAHDALQSAIAHLLDQLRNSVDQNSLFLEICANNFPGETMQIDDLVHCASQFNIPVIASANAHYLNDEDRDAHTVLLGIKNDLKLQQLKHRRKNIRAHVFSNEEMQEIYKSWPESLTNTLRIAEQCNLKLEFGKYYLPKIKLEESESTHDALGRLAREGLEQRFATLSPLYGPNFDETKKQDYRDRLEYEIKVICDMGFPDYFLIVQDFINWAKRNDIPVGPGRGSGAGSLVAYALRITDLDPIPYNLIFERFLNPERVSMPDFDVDFCQDRRDEVIRYVSHAYGKENVAQITTFGKMLAKAVVRDVGRVLDISYTRVDRIAKLIPMEIGIKLKDALEKEPRLKQEAEKDPLIGDLLKIALKLEGISRHTSVHAAGIVISDGAMENYVPVYRSEDGSLITQFEMKNAEKVGLVKFDFLGLKTLTVIKKAIDLIENTTGHKIDITAIPLDDRKVYQLISDAKSVGVFQLESSGMQQLLLKLKPSTFEDIIALVALFRPGPLQSGMVDDFVERKHGRQKIEYLHPALEPILKDTYGTILYQEQVQKIAAVLANYTLGEADLLRRAMGKKKPEEMAKQKDRFVKGCADNQIDITIASTLFDLMAKFAEYGFNKSHSAAYGLVSYQTGYLKANFPAPFLAASMTCDMDNTDKIVRYVQDCKAMGIKVLPPDINQSDVDFLVSDQNCIRFALAAIKGIGRTCLEELVSERTKNGAFSTLSDLARRVNLNRLGKKTLELLIQAGALDFLNIPRPAMFSKVGELVKFSLNHHEAKSVGQMNLFAEMELDEKSNKENECSDQFANIESDWFYQRDPQSDDSEALWLQSEKKLLGVYLSKHPVQLYADERARYSNARLRELPKMPGQSDIYVFGILNDQFERTTKEGKRMLVLRIEDEDEEIAPAFFEGDYPDNLPPLDSPVICKFRVMKGFENFPPRPKLEKIWSLQEFRCLKVKSFSLCLHPMRAGEDATASPLSPSNAALDDLISRVHKILSGAPGSTPVSFKIDYGKTKVKLSTGLQLTPTNELISQLKSLNTKRQKLIEIEMK